MLSDGIYPIRPKPPSESSDKTTLYLSVVNASRDEGKTVGKRRFSAFKRRQDHLQRRSPRRDMARFCQSTILQSGHSSLLQIAVCGSTPGPYRLGSGYPVVTTLPKSLVRLAFSALSDLASLSWGLVLARHFWRTSPFCAFVLQFCLVAYSFPGYSLAQSFSSCFPILIAILFPSPSRWFPD